MTAVLVILVLLLAFKFYGFWGAALVGILLLMFM